MVLSCNETAQSLLYAVERVSDAVGLIDEIAEASNQQAKSVEQVTIGVNQISEVIQTNSATSEESAAASEELSGQSHLMQQLVGRFQLNGMDDRNDEWKLLWEGYFRSI